MKNLFCLILCLCVCFAAVPAFGTLAECSDDLIYTVSGGEATVTGYSGSSGEVVIPSKLGGYPVTAIAELAFYNNRSITSITLPETLKSIGSQAFMFCNNLKSVYISDATAWSQTELAGIQSSPFQASPTLYVNGEAASSLTFESGITEIKSFTFYGLSQLTDVTVPEGVTAIGADAFYNCSGIKSIKLPRTLESIGDYAFYGCSALSDAVLTENLSSIGTAAFRYCALPEIVIPDKVTAISSFAFADNTKAGFISIGHGIESISTYVFYGCTSATTVYIGSGVKTIGAQAFYNVGSGKSKSFFYCGTEAEWDSIEISTTANTPITSAKYLGHPYSEDWVVDSEPTLVSAGSKAQVCMHCGKKGNSTDIPKLTPNSSHLVLIRQLLIFGKNDLSFDLNGDNTISIKDLICLKKALAELSTLEGLWVSLDKATGRVAYIDFESGKLLSGSCVQNDTPDADMPSFELDGITYSVTGGTYGSYSRLELDGNILTVYPYAEDEAYITFERTDYSTLTVTAVSAEAKSDFSNFAENKTLTHIK